MLPAYRRGYGTTDTFCPILRDSAGHVCGLGKTLPIPAKTPAILTNNSGFFTIIVANDTLTNTEISCSGHGGFGSWRTP